MNGALLVCAALAAFNPSWPASDPDLPPQAFARSELMPDDPDYAPVDDGARCTGQHGLYGFVPNCAYAIAPEERRLGLGVGASVDRAWTYTTGRGDVAIAVLADGVDFSDPDLVSRWRLDPGELTPPATSSIASSQHDINGDGIFSVQDYTTATGTAAPTIDRVIDLRLIARADRGDTNGNGLLDPQDLIRIFSDGVDDDEDGYVDDIAGWDHLDDDNDPSVETGARYARTIAASANNGIGGAGACPSCALLAMRVGAEGRSHAHVLALAITYAVDEAASVVATFTSVLEATSFLEAATGYAFDRGVLIVADAGNEGGRRRAVPWNPDRVLIVGGVGYDDDDNRAATTSMAPDPCSRFGAQLSAVAPSRCDGTGAAIAAGAAGLLYSAARGIPARGVPALEPPLSASEALQLLTTSTEDVPPAIGWDERTGHGRIDARRALDAVVTRRVPPWSQLTSPRWYEVVDPLKRDTVFATATIVNSRYDRVAWTITAAPGLEPDPDGFVAVVSGTVEAGEVATVETEVPIVGLFGDPAAPPDAYGEFAVTLRLVTRTSLGGDVVLGASRRVFFVHRDLELLPAFPLWLGSGVVAAPRIADLDGDGALEIIVATVDGMIRTVDLRGTVDDDFEIRTSPSALIRRHLKAPAFSSEGIGADVAQTIVAAPSEHEGLLVARTSEGVVLSIEDGEAATVTTSTNALGGSRPSGATSPPVLVDLDGDGKVDVVTADHGSVEAHSVEGEPIAGWPIEVEGLAGTPAVGDIDGDGRMEVVVVAGGELYRASADGVIDTPIRLPPPVARARAPFFAPSPALGDLDGDGATDIAVAVAGGPLALFDTGARTATTLREVTGGSDIEQMGPRLLCGSNQATVAELASDTPSALTSVAPISTIEGLGTAEATEIAIAAFSPSGRHQPGFPRLISEPHLLDLLVVDLDGDRRSETVMPEADHLRVVAHDGSRPRRYPKITGDEVIGTPAVADLDQDGLLELVAVTRTGQLFVWRTRGPTGGRVSWAGARHDNRATGNLETPTLIREQVETTGGCACNGTERSRGGWWLFALFALFSFVPSRR